MSQIKNYLRSLPLKASSLLQSDIHLNLTTTATPPDLQGWRIEEGGSVRGKGRFTRESSTYFGHFSRRSSGTTVTSDMYIKPPAVNGNIAAVLSPACSAESDMRAVRAPSRPPLAVNIYK